jgi:hypothetical protein
MPRLQSSKAVALIAGAAISFGGLILLDHLVAPSGASIKPDTAGYAAAPRSPAYPDEAMDTTLESSDGDFDYTFIFPEMPPKQLAR